MGETRRLYSVHDGVIRETIVDDCEPSRLVVHTRQHLDEILDGIARDRELLNKRGDNKHVARLPMTIVENLIERGIYDDPNAFDRWLNSSEATPWRIWPGRV